MLITYPEGDASVACWSNIGVLEPGVFSVTVAFAFKTAFIRNKEKRKRVMLTLKKKGQAEKKNKIKHKSPYQPHSRSRSKLYQAYSFDNKYTLHLDNRIETLKS